MVYNARKGKNAMKKGIILLADGFEQVEALATEDILLRTGEIKPMLVSISASRRVVSSSGLHVYAEATLDEVDPREFDFLVLPGGKRGVENLGASEKVLSLIRDYHEQGKPHYAICAAPSILGNLGYLDGKSYTCFPGFERGNGNWVDAGAVKDGDLITGRSMAYTIEFAENIVEALLGEEALLRTRPGTRGLRK